jgi:ERCC4-type nuclease
MRTNDSFNLPNLKMSIAFKEPQQQPAQVHVQLTPLCQQQQRPPPSPISRTLNMAQSDVIVLDSDDDIDASPMLQPTSAFMESDSLEFLGTENPNEWNSAADDAIDLFAASEYFPYRERVPHDAQVATLMCKTERVEQQNYRNFYYGAVRAFEIHGQGRVHNDRKLPLGDFQFHYQCSGDNPDEPSLASDVVIERKTISDIVTSSAGDRDSSGTARHIRQESRLRHCKLTRACMLIEGIPDNRCPHLPGPRTSHDRQLQNPDCLHTKEDVMNYQAQVLARNYASNQVFVLQSPNEQHSQLLLAAISQVLAAPSDQPREAVQVSKFDEFCRQQCRATSKMQAKLSREGVHCELLARLARRFPDEQSVAGVLEACSRPLDRAQLFQHLQVAGSNQDCKLLQTMPQSEYTKEEAVKSGAIIYKTLFGSTILPQPSHKQTCSSAETQVMGSSHAIKACVDDPAHLPLDSGIRVHRDDTECDSDCADVLRCWSQNCCSSSQAIHVSIAHGVDVLQLFLQAIQDGSSGEADEKEFCMAVALGVGKQVIRPLVAAQQRWTGGKSVTSLLVLEDVVNGNGGACTRFKKRVAQSQANGDSRCQLENGSDFHWNAQVYSNETAACSLC